MGDADEKSIVECRKVGWYEPLQLFRTALMVLTSTVFGRNADRRLIEALASEGGLRKFPIGLALTAVRRFRTFAELPSAGWNRPTADPQPSLWEPVFMPHFGP